MSDKDKSESIDAYFAKAFAPINKHGTPLKNNKRGYRPKIELPKDKVHILALLKSKAESMGMFTNALAVQILETYLIEEDLLNVDGKPIVPITDNEEKENEETNS